jgi:hypothetical protein
MRRLPLALLLFVLLAGCAERWTRPGVTEAEADAANAACTDRATLAVPPQLSWQMIEPPRHDRERRCERQGDREVCRTFTRYTPARYGWVDLARSPRDAWRRECMRGQGFRFEGYRPLRLFGTEDAPRPVDAPPPEG